MATAAPGPLQPGATPDVSATGIGASVAPPRVSQQPFPSDFTGNTTAVNAAWRNASEPTGESPGNRSYIQGQMAYDPADGYMVLFGGFVAGTGYVNDTWIFEGGNWTELHPTTSPPPLDHASMSWDPAGGYLVLFGGIAPNHPSYDATWDFLHGDWTELTPSPSPSARWGSALAWDAADGYLLLFGGCGGSAELNDTWAFSNGTWTEIANRSAPSAREDAGMAYDPGLGRVVLFGGENTTGGVEKFNDTWEYGGGTWTRMTTPSAPSNRSGFGFAYFAPLGVEVLYGGSSPSLTVLADTWELDDGRWTNASSLGGPPAPGPAVLQGMAYDPSATSIVMFGGADSTIGYSIDGTWAYYTLNLTLGATPSSGDAPLNVTFAASPSDGVAPYQLNWTLDDGSSATGPTVDRTYSDPGTYSVEVTATDAYGVAAVSVASVTVYPGLLASAALSPATGSAPLAVSYSASFGGGDPPYTSAWTFGDGGDSGSPNGSHVYLTAGNYTARLALNDSGGGTWSQTFAIAVTAAIAPAPPLSIALSVNRSVGDAPFPVALTASVDGGTGPYTYAWELGDGNASTAAAVFHTYASAGGYEASVRVTDSAGTSATANATLSIYAPLAVSIESYPPTGPAPLTVTLTAQEMGGEPSVAYTWEFGDGSVASGNPVSHRYVQGGNYTVDVVAVDGAGSTAQATATVEAAAMGASGNSPPSSTSGGGVSTEYAAALAAGTFAVGAAVGVGAILLSRRARRD